MELQNGGGYPAVSFGCESPVFNAETQESMVKEHPSCSAESTAPGRCNGYSHPEVNSRSRANVASLRDTASRMKSERDF